MSRDARKIFLLFKSVIEFHILRKKFQDFLWLPNKFPIILDIIQRLGYLIYWVFDNIQTLANFKFINADPIFNLKIASLGWLIALLFGIARHIYDIIDHIQIKYEERNKKLIFKNLIQILGKLGDLLDALNGLGIPRKILGKQLNDGIIGIGGLFASLVSLWNLYPNKG